MESGSKANLDGASPVDMPSDSPSSQTRKRSEDQAELELVADCEVKNDEHAVYYVPDCLLDEILIRLPVKFIFQYKCVYKRWLSLISTPSFGRSYCLYWQARIDNSSATLPWTFLYRHTWGQQLDHIPDQNKLHHLYSLGHSAPQFTVLHSFPHDRIEIITENNGLLLCNQIHADTYYVCNPITNQWVALPRMPSDRIVRHGRRRRLFMGQLFSDTIKLQNNEGLVALVEDGQVTRYKVVAPRGCFSFFVFSSETGEWTDFTPVCHPPTPLHSSCLSNPIVVNGTLYWHEYVRGAVLAYEPFGANETCVHLIGLPRTYYGEEYSRMCGVSGGCLRFYELSEMNGAKAAKVWELEDSKSGQWSIKHACAWTDVWSDDEYLSKHLIVMGSSSHLCFVPVAFHPFDVDVIYMHNGRCIASYNFRDRRMDIVFDLQHYITELSWPEGFSWCNVMPFVLPLWPTPVPQPLWQVDT